MKYFLGMLSLILLLSCSHLGSNDRSLASASEQGEAHVPGDIKISLLSPKDFRKLHGDVWVLMDGGTDLQQLVAENSNVTLADFGSKIPDARGKFLRMSNNQKNCENKSSCTMDPQDNREVGSYQADELRSHSHKNRVHYGGASGVFWGMMHSGNMTGFEGGRISSTGGHENRPKNIAVNFYVKISYCPKGITKKCL
jgi:hypothetical protein